MPVRDQPWELHDKDGLDLFQVFLSAPERRLPVVMLTEAEELAVGRTYKVSRFVLDPAKLASDLIGLSHVVLMPRELGFEWTRRVGRPWTAFNGAIRTYRPSINFDSDDPHRHPLARLDDIVLWEYDGIFSKERSYGENAFHCFLLEKAFQTINARPLRLEETLFYRYAKTRALEQDTRVDLLRFSLPIVIWKTQLFHTMSL